jgi:DTW domain-containing protein YfiP
MGEESSDPSEFFSLEEMSGVMLGLSTSQQQAQAKAQTVTPPVVYRATLGLVLRLRSGAKRWLKSSAHAQSLSRAARLGDKKGAGAGGGSQLLAMVWQLFRAWADPSAVAHWNEAAFAAMQHQLVEHCRYLSQALFARLDHHTLHPPPAAVSDSCGGGVENHVQQQDVHVLVIDPWYEAEVKAYHDRVSRPEEHTLGQLTKLGKRGKRERVDDDDEEEEEEEGGCYDGGHGHGHSNGAAIIQDRGTRTQGRCAEEEGDECLEALQALPRGVCQGCGVKCSVYCGRCHGRRLEESEALLPARIALPFDICLLVHHREKVATCTGIHAAVMTVPATVAVEHWVRCEGHSEESSSDALIKSFDPTRHVVLFPSADAQVAQEFTWMENSLEGRRFESGAGVENAEAKADADASAEAVVRKRCLVVLEANWTEGAKMAKRIERVRAAAKLPPLPCVRLQDSVVGAFWKMQESSRWC